MWVLPDVSGTGIHFLVSYPTHTLSFTARPDDEMQQDEDNEVHINTEMQTLAAGLTEVCNNFTRPLCHFGTFC